MKSLSHADKPIFERKMKPSDHLRAEFDRLLAQLEPRDWTVSEHATYFGFFAHGWHARANEAAYQRAIEEQKSE